MLALLKLEIMLLPISGNDSSTKHGVLIAEKVRKNPFWTMDPFPSF